MQRTKTKLSTTVSVMCLSSTWWATAQAQDFLLEEVEEVEEVPIYDREIEVGAGYVTEDSPKFGEYTGLDEEGPYPILNFQLRGRAPYDSDSTRYYGVTGRNLGLDSRSVEAEYGEQGRYDLFLEYDQIPHFRFEGVTPYRGVGTGDLALPPGWVAAPSTDGFAALDASLREVDIETERQRFTGGLTWRFLENWSVGASFRHEDKEGLDTIAGAFGTNGGNPSAAILPEPIDYETDTFDVNLQYAGSRAQLGLSYEFSAFQNKIESLRFQNPYSAAGRGGPWAPETGFPTGFGEFALPPDNTAHQVAITGAYSLGETTRLTGHAAYGRLEQDEDFLPFSAIPALQASVTTPLPRDSLDARIDTYLVDLGVSTRPLPALDLRANYQYDLRDNNTPMDTYVRIRSDSDTQPAGLANDSARTNLPYDYEQHKADLEAGYRILPQTKASLAYTFDHVSREFQEVAVTREHTVSGKVASSPLPYANGWIEYGHGIRDGSDYVDNRPFLESHTDEFLATLPPEERFENHPALRKFHIADRDRDFVNAAVDLTPLDQVGIGFRVGYSQDDYDESVLGLTDASNLHATVDVSYSPRSDFTSFAYFTYEQIDFEQRGHSWNPFSLPSLTDPAQRWSVDTTDDVFTTGVGFTWSIIEDTLDLTADYTLSYATTSFDIAGGSALEFAPLPDVETTLHSVGVGIEYALRQDLSVALGYRFENLSTDDFAVDGIEPDTIPFVLGIGRDSPDYSVHVFGTSLKLRF